MIGCCDVRGSHAKYAYWLFMQNSSNVAVAWLTWPQWQRLAYVTVLA